jgi:uncharacterized protein YjiS (DUF1127 family)
MNTHRFSLRRLVRETVLYIGASPRSRWPKLGTLRALDEHMLRDIGVSRSGAESGTIRAGDIAGLSSGF